MRVTEKNIDVVMENQKARDGCLEVKLGQHIIFDTEELEYFAFESWKPLVYDAMIVAASVEAADKMVSRPRSGWTRRLSISIPVKEIECWSSPDVRNSLKDAIEFLTGDYWEISFKPSGNLCMSSKHVPLPLEGSVDSVIAFSEGMDSLMVARIIESEGDELVRVRVKKGKANKSKSGIKQEKFIPIPYSVKASKQNKTIALRSRGFKFAMVGGIACYLTNAKRVVVPESGQGVIGPALIHLGQMYPDYRNHPLFTKRMERLLESLFQRSFRFDFPRIWKTKGETLEEFIELPGERNAWRSTRSCWKPNRSSSVNKKYRQCGICAACMLRRMSIHTAGLTEVEDAYISSNLNASTLEGVVDPGFLKKLRKGFREYAAAGVLSMHNLSELADAESAGSIQRHAMFLGTALNISIEEAEEKLTRLINKHAEEWSEYISSLGPESYIRKLARWN